MDERRIVGIGPLSPPITGPGLKNRYLRQGLENAGFQVRWVNTLERDLSTVLELMKRYWTGSRFLVSASTKVRLGVVPPLAQKLSLRDARAALLPAGGALAEELRSLPVGIRERYIHWFSQFDCILPESSILSTELTDLLEPGVYVSTLPNLRPIPPDPPQFEPFTGVNRPLRLVYVGRIKETKGLDYLLDAVDQLTELGRNVSLDMFGHFLPGDPYKERFLEKCDSTSSAQFLGKVEDGGVIQRLREYDVFVFPSYYPGEGFPGVFIEAFAGGCLIVASDWNYNSELISDGTDGLLFAPRDSDDLRHTLEWLITNPEAVERFKRNSWQNSKKYSIDTVTNQLIDVFDRTGWW